MRECKAASVCALVWVCERGLVIHQRKPVFVHKARPDVKQKPDPWAESYGPSFDLTSTNIKDLNTPTRIHVHTVARARNCMKCMCATKRMSRKPF